MKELHLNLKTIQKAYKRYGISINLPSRAPNLKEIKFKTSPSLFFLFLDFRAAPPPKKQWSIERRKKVYAQIFMGNFRSR
jgi:hypothetical protein